MHKIIAGALIGGSLAVGGCTTNRQDAQSEVIGPYGQVLPPTAVPSGATPALRLLVTDPSTESHGATNTFYLHQDGTGQIVIEPNRAAVAIRWSIPSSNALCFDWPVRGRECWPYQSLRIGQPVRVTSDQNVTAELTLLRALHSGQQPATQQPAPNPGPTNLLPPRRSGERG